ncbi:uncharacterized protein JCM6883_004796 [Sporobolomyces salmoneus]|uniref:uncharacterized protein n=1 Tax=Sporobolomyces salmoneus TaxID=183962 RepID=UPI00317322A2
MAKSTPKASKVGTPAKSTPAKASPAPSSASKKRVRVVESDNTAEAPSSAKKSKSKESTSASASKTAKNGVEMKDLKEKKLDEIEKIRSKDAPQPEKGALKGKGKKVATQEEEIKLDEEEEQDEEDDNDKEAYLEGFESGEEGEDSSDDEEEVDEKNAKPFNLEELPKVKGDSVQKKLEAKAERKKNAKTGTIYLGRIPHGFHEAEMKSYFSQFGEVTRLRLSRNKQTGASKHYAFIEFQYASVAAIVQETMDNYLLSGHILVCKIIPDDQIHPKLWVGANRKFRVVPKGRKQNAKRDAPKTEEKKESIKKRLLTREEKKRKELAELGIEYDFAGYAGKTVEGEKKEEAEPTPKKGGKKGRKSVEGAGPAKKKARKST